MCILSTTTQPQTTLKIRNTNRINAYTINCNLNIGNVTDNINSNDKSINMTIFTCDNITTNA